MLSLPPLVDNTDKTLEDTYKRIIPQIEEARIATGYFYLSGFDLYREDLKKLADPDELEHAPLRILIPVLLVTLLGNLYMIFKGEFSSIAITPLNFRSQLEFAKSQLGPQELDLTDLCSRPEIEYTLH